MPGSAAGTIGIGHARVIFPGRSLHNRQSSAGKAADVPEPFNLTRRHGPRWSPAPPGARWRFVALETTQRQRAAFRGAIAWQGSGRFQALGVFTLLEVPIDDLRSFA